MAVRFLDTTDKEELQVQINNIINGQTITSPVTLTEPNTVYEKCEFNTTVIVDADYAVFLNCVFHEQVTVNKRYAKFDNCVFTGYTSINEDTGNTEYTLMANSALVINKEAFDGVLNNATIRNIAHVGVVNKSYGWNFRNFTISHCQWYGMWMRDGGFQIQNGRICMCGTRHTQDCGGLYIAPDETMLGNIPEVTISGLSVQQNYGFGIKMERVTNSYVNALLLANNANVCGGGKEGEPVDEVNGVCQTLFKTGDGITYRHYGMQLIDCKNVTGHINGVSCHKYWYGADLGYNDNAPLQNNIQVTWEPVYTDEGTWSNSHLFFAKFLPTVNVELSRGAEIVHGARTAQVYTEKDLRYASDSVNISNASTTFTGFTNSIQSIGSDGKVVEASGAANRLRLYLKGPGDNGTDVISRKGVFRLYIEAPGLNIYPYVRIVGRIKDPWYGAEHNGSKLQKYYRSGQNSVWSGIVTYDVTTETADNLNITSGTVLNTPWPEETEFRYLELRILFNKVSDLPEGTVIKPKVRIEYLQY